MFLKSLLLSTKQQQQRIFVIFSAPYKEQICRKKSEALGPADELFFGEIFQSIGKADGADNI